MTLVGVNTMVLAAIPDELTLRESLLTPVIGFGLFTAFLLISIAKLLKTDIFSSLIISNTKIQSLHTFIRESYALNKGGSILLIINYLVSFSVVLTIISGFSGVQMNNELLLIGIVPLALLLWSLGSMLVLGFIVGERQVFTEPIEMKLVGTQLLGLLFFVIALVLSLHSFGESFFLIVVIWVFIIETIIRLFKSILVVYLRGVSWYYIILYFCTLEILPLFVAYYLLLRDFKW